jgi:hypothetical protein
MSKHRITALLACALVCAGTAASFASQAELAGIGWELSRLEGKTRSPFAPVTELKASPELKFSDNLRALVTLQNSAAVPAEGLVLRYSLSLRLLRAGDPAEKAFWAVPFSVEEVRVSKVNAASSRQVKLLHLELAEQLRKLRSSGFTPLALKLQVMLCPRQGDEPAAIMRESVIDILKP